MQNERCSIRGQRLFNQGDEIRRFFYVESGRMKLYRLSPDGDEKSNAGLIQVERQAITLLDIDGLRNLLESPN